MDDHHLTQGAEEHPIAPAERPTGAVRNQAPRTRKASGAPKTDIGTLVLHWVVALAFIVSLFTGIRIAADALVAPVSQWLTPILPQGDMWTWHFMSGLVLFFGASAYVLYMIRSGLTQRNAIKKTRVLADAGAARNEMGRGQCHPALVRLRPHRCSCSPPARCSISVMAAGGSICIRPRPLSVSAYIFVHVVAHYMHGGWWQVLRIFNPARLVITRAVQPKPLLIGSLVGLAVGRARSPRPTGRRAITLTIARTIRAGAQARRRTRRRDLEKRACRSRSRRIRAQPRAGTGSSTVQVWAAHDGQKMYFAFKWQDPTRSMRRIPLIKREDGWHLLQGSHDRADLADVNDFYEDKLAVGITTTRDFRRRRQHLSRSEAARRQSGAVCMRAAITTRPTARWWTCGNGKRRVAGISVLSTTNISASRAT